VASSLFSALSRLCLVWLLGTAARAATEERKCVPLNREVLLALDRGKLVCGETDIHLDHTVALGTGQVMVVVVATDAVVVGTIRELDAIEQACIHQHLD